MNPTEQKTQDYHKAIKNVVEHLKSKRSELQNEINVDEKEKAQLLGEMNKLQDRLSVVDANLRKKSEFRKEYDKAITQSEENFVELLRKSEDFLSLTRREVLALSQVVCDSPRLCKGDQQRQEQEASSRSEPQPCCASPSAVFFAERPKDVSQGEQPQSGNCAAIVIPYRANGL